MTLSSRHKKFELWRSEADHTTSQSRRLPTILTFTRGWGRNIFCFFQTAETWNRTPSSGVKGSGSNHYPINPRPISPMKRPVQCYSNLKMQFTKNTSRRPCVKRSSYFLNRFLFYVLLINKLYKGGFYVII